MKTFFLGVLKILLFGIFLISLATFSGIATIHYIFATSRVEVPDLIGKDVVYATDLLAEQHLKLKIVEQRLDETIAVDHILTQDPTPGTMVKKSHTIRIVASKGSESTFIPDVVGKPWQAGQTTLATAAIPNRKYRVRPFVRDSGGCRYCPDSASEYAGKCWRCRRSSHQSRLLSQNYGHARFGGTTTPLWTSSD